MSVQRDFKISGTRQPETKTVAAATLKMPAFALTAIA
jgi:hypothetical protein